MGKVSPNPWGLEWTEEELGGTSGPRGHLCPPHSDGPRGVWRQQMLSGEPIICISSDGPFSNITSVMRHQPRWEHLTPGTARAAIGTPLP